MKHNNHEYVDLGLPSGTLWATCNVGANSPEEYGDYFALCETKPKDSYEDITYKFQYGGSFNIIYTKYNATDYKATLDPEDDAAAANWGGRWRMPTSKEWSELIVNCRWTWATLNGVNGYKVTSKTNGKSIFLPAAGERWRDKMCYGGDIGEYWTSSLNVLYEQSLALSVFFMTNEFYIDAQSSRFTGKSVRPVCKKILTR